MEAFLRAYRGESTEDVYGLPLEALGEEYEREAPWGYSSEGCLEEAVSLVTDEHEETFEIDCATNGVRHLVGLYPGSVASSKNLGIERAGRYELRLEGGLAVQVLRCLDPVVSTEEPDLEGGVYHDADLSPPNPYLFADGAHELELDASVHRFTVYGTDELDEDSVRLILRRLK